MQKESCKKLLLYGKSPLSDNYMKLSNLKSYGGHQNKTLCMTFVFITTYKTTLLFSYTCVTSKANLYFGVTYCLWSVSSLSVSYKV